MNLVWTCLYLACDHLVLWSVDIAFKKIIMMLIDGLKPSLDEQEQILLIRKRNVACQNNKNKQLHNSFYPLNKPRILYQ